MTLKIKIITGFRKEQEHSIDSDEAHKAYFLFLNPEHRTVFANGLALRGSEIQRIEPDYQGTMGWNPSYPLGPDDWNEIRRRGVDVELKNLLSIAHVIGKQGAPGDMLLTMTEVMQKYPELVPGKRPGGMQRIGPGHE